MHYFSEAAPPSPVRCRECKLWFLRGDADACDLDHEGNGCCHVGDTAIPAPPEGTDPGFADLADMLTRMNAETEAFTRRADAAEAAIAELHQDPEAQARADKIYVDIGVISMDEIKKLRYRDGDDGTACSP